MRKKTCGVGGPGGGVYAGNGEKVAIEMFLYQVFIDFYYKEDAPLR